MKAAKMCSRCCMCVRALRMCFILWNFDQAMTSLRLISWSVLSWRVSWRPRMVIPCSLSCFPGRHCAALGETGDIRCLFLVDFQTPIAKRILNLAKHLEDLFRGLCDQD